MRTRRYRAVTALAGMVLLPGLSSPEPAQAQAVADGGDFLPALSPLPRLQANPREPGSFGKLFFVADPDTPLGRDVQGEAALGGTFPIYRLWGGAQDYGVIAVRAGFFARFSLERQFGEFLSGDWVFSLPLMIKQRGNWYRIGYYHYSAHTADGISAQTAAELGLDFRYERNAIEGAASFALGPKARVYGGALYSFIGAPNTDQPGLYAGFELGGPRLLGHETFLASHVATDVDRNFSSEITGQAGLKLGVPGGRRMRLVLEAFRGPSTQRQFFRDTATYFGLGLYYDF